MRRGAWCSADVPTARSRKLGHVPSAEPEHPVDGATDAQGWTTVSGVYRVPAKATRAIVELHLQWAPNGRVEWSEVEFAKTEPPPPRKVRLATIHYKPTGKSPRANCEEFAPLIAEAGKQKADLVVLGETVPSVGVTTETARDRRSHSRTDDRLLRRTRQETQPAHRAEPVRTGRAPRLQHGRACSARTAS